VHPAQGITFEARWQRQRQVTAGRLVEEPRRHARAHGMELPFGQGPFQPKEQPAIGRRGIIQAIDIRNQAALIATEVQEWIPVRAVAREPRDIIGQDDADLSERHVAHQHVEALPVLGARRALANIAVDDFNGLRGPAQRLSTLGQGILEPEACLMAQRLVWGRLANIDDRFAGQMVGRDDLGAVHLRLSRFMIYWASHHRRHHSWHMSSLPTCRTARRSSSI
jgi:hypothetical protein